MLTTSHYLLGAAALLASIASLTVFGRAIQLHWLKEWHGPEAIIARAIAGLSAAMIICYILGSLGAFSLVPLTIAFLVTGPVAQLALKPKGNGFGEYEETSGRAALPLAIGGLMLFGVWLLQVRYSMRVGLTGTDALWYHMPFAQRFFQTESLLSFNYAEPLFQTYFYPSSGSVFHALGMVFFHRDFLSPLINMVWLGLALLAGAAIGHREGVAATSALGVAAVFAADGVLRGSAGSAMVDTPSTFFFLAAALLLIRGAESRPALVLAALSTGLGLSVKLTIAIPTAALTIAVIVLAKKGDRVKSLAIWLVGVFAKSAFWFIRNISETGNPLPLLKLPLLTGPGKALQSDNMVPISKYFTDTNVMFHMLPNAWNKSLGPGALFVIAIAVIGSLVLVIKPPAKVWRVMSFVALATMAGYFFTPGTAAGPPGGPMRGLFWDTRFIAPGLSLGLALAPVTLAKYSARLRDLSALPLAILVVIPATRSKWWVLTHPRLPLIAASVIVIGIFLVGNYYGKVGPKARAAFLVFLALFMAGGGKYFERSYAHGREKGYGPSLAATGHSRIGIIGEAGTFTQYLQSGADLSNYVEFIGVHGPHGAFRPANTCAALKELVNNGRFGYVITSPNRDIWNRSTYPNKQVLWIAQDPNAKFVKEIPGLAHNTSSTGSDKPDTFSVYRITGPLSPKSCAAAPVKR
ncbi:MAG: hypothetical protein WCJ63_01620 [Actinomycetes bacterium]